MANPGVNITFVTRAWKKNVFNCCHYLFWGVCGLYGGLGQNRSYTDTQMRILFPFLDNHLDYFWNHISTHWPSTRAQSGHGLVSIYVMMRVKILCLCEMFHLYTVFCGEISKKSFRIKYWFPSRIGRGVNSDPIHPPSRVSIRIYKLTLSNFAVRLLQVRITYNWSRKVRCGKP